VVEQKRLVVFATPLLGYFLQPILAATPHAEGVIKWVITTRASGYRENNAQIPRKYVAKEPAIRGE
jgi:hypothetical protein